MRTFVFLACVCAVAQAQFGGPQTTFAQSSASFGNSRYSAQPTSRPQFGSQQAQQNSFGSPRQNAFASQPNAFGTQQSSFGSQSRQSFETRNQQQQQLISQSAGLCREKNERYPVSGSCDRYIECILDALVPLVGPVSELVPLSTTASGNIDNGTAQEKLCPDGLRYNPDVNFDVYPCQYPNQVPCLGRSSLQPPQPTAECEHQFGFQRLGDARNCSGFRSCVNGAAFDFTCPEGLAFSAESYRCEWPDEVADCDVEAFLGFRCPEVPISRELGPPAGYRFYRSEANCQKYFICIEGRPRALSCGGDSAFDELTSACVSADEVSACPPELRAQAQRSRDEEQQRLAKQLKFDAKPPQLKGRY